MFRPTGIPVKSLDGTVDNNKLLEPLFKDIPLVVTVPEEIILTTDISPASYDNLFVIGVCIQ